MKFMKALRVPPLSATGRTVRLAVLCQPRCDVIPDCLRGSDRSIKLFSLAFAFPEHSILLFEKADIIIFGLIEQNVAQFDASLTVFHRGLLQPSTPRNCTIHPTRRPSQIGGEFAQFIAERAK
jgi:hypothetical protein